MHMSDQVQDNVTEILAELKDLQDSPLVGRINFLMSKIKSPTLPPEAIKIIEAFVNHSDYQIRLDAKNLIAKYK